MTSALPKTQKHRETTLNFCPRERPCFVWTFDVPPVQKVIKSRVFSLWGRDWQLKMKREEDDDEEEEEVVGDEGGNEDENDGENDDENDGENDEEEEESGIEWRVYLSKWDQREKATKCLITTHGCDKKGNLRLLDTFPFEPPFPDPKICICEIDEFQILQKLVDVELQGTVTFVFTFDSSAYAKLSDIEKASETEDKVIKTDPGLVNNPCLESLSADLKRLAEDGTQQDVQLQCEGQTILAHRAILCARSKVLAGMLQDDMPEKGTGLKDTKDLLKEHIRTFEIQDLEFPVLQQFLRYLYSGTTSSLTVELASRLFEAGEKYSVQALKKKCADFLKENLTVNNACTILVLANAHNDHQFKEFVISYILEHEVPKKNKEWPTFCAFYPMLGMEVLNQHVFRKW